MQRFRKNEKLKKSDLKKKVHDIYVLLQEIGKDKSRYCFFKVRLFGRIPNKNHSYRGDSFLITYICGDRQLFEARKTSASSRIYNGYCLATRKFFHQDLYEKVRGNWDIFLRELFKPSKPKSYYEIMCRQEYFRNMDAKSYEKKFKIMMEMMKEYYSPFELEKELNELETGNLEDSLDDLKTQINTLFGSNSSF